ncbi:calcium-binding protein [Roseomonas fluvialis]|uniref:Hemolysin expression modulating protein n=1 Tax=Roseomonas fluvialis TaxID=1750527 RepID=A0ABN6NZW1_9PROT|nr:calcium-binding protein [Roseomonas fluvialis]BDG71949.1 hemolysin expression modulating protein [Roseomonas fluvialis]
MADFATLPGGLLFGGNDADLIDADIDIPGSFDNLIASFGGSDTVRSGSGDDLVFAGKGTDVVLAGSGDDIVFGDDGDDLLNGESGDDVLDGGKGDDLLNGGDGKDRLLGGDGKDTLAGGAGDDWLAGGKSDDVLAGGAGKDTLAGGTGDDTLTGGAAEDTFFFESGFGRDVVLDFRPGDDVIAIKSNINGTGITSTGQLADRISSDDTGAVIDLGGGDQIKLVGVSSEDLIDNLSSYFRIV